MSTDAGAGAGTGRWLDWAQVDVFAEQAYQGNMLAIFTDATGLSTQQMQSLARETNLSETTFILPAPADEEREHGVRVRIFTVDEELPFAGHPTLGTASWLWANHAVLRGAQQVRLRLNVGTIEVQFRAPTPGEPGVYGEMRQRDAEFGTRPDAAAIAAACGLDVTDLHATLPPQVVSTGLPFCIVPLASLDALRRLRVNPDLLQAALGGTGAKLLSAITPAADAGVWRVRMPFNGSDDPATGSAAGCAISYLVMQGAVASGAPITIDQGSEVNRPSRLYVRASYYDNAVTNVFVAGRTIPVASGRFLLA